MRTPSIHHYQGAPLITLQRRHLVGHDILLARHGNHICSMRVDRGNGTVVALLDDGSVLMTAAAVALGTTTDPATLEMFTTLSYGTMRP